MVICRIEIRQMSLISDMGLSLHNLAKWKRFDIKRVEFPPILLIYGEGYSSVLFQLIGFYYIEACC